MPFTPLHMGPGLAIKAIAGRRFSVLSFGLAQVAMDIEPLVGIVRGADVLHGPTHTWLAALAIGLAVAAISPPVCRPILRRWNGELSRHRLSWLVEPGPSTPGPVLAGAFAGTISHVLLDSIMHFDIAPLSPWSDANALRGLVSIEALHRFCVISGVLGILGWFAAGWLGRRTRQGPGA